MKWCSQAQDLVGARPLSPTVYLTKQKYVYMQSILSRIQNIQGRLSQVSILAGREKIISVKGSPLIKRDTDTVYTFTMGNHGRCCLVCVGCPGNSSRSNSSRPNSSPQIRRGSNSPRVKFVARSQIGSGSHE